MSWQTYVDKNLIGAGFIGASICGFDGSVWASKNLTLKPNEVITFLSDLKNDYLSSKGIVIAGNKYMTLKSDQDSAYGKLGSGGIVLCKTNKSLIIAIYNEKLTPGSAVTFAEKLSDYLKQNNY